MVTGPKPEDFTNKTINNILLLSFSHKKSNKRYWICKCFCGNEFTTVALDVKYEHTTSCGCKIKEHLKSGKARRTHGKRKSLEYNTWAKLKDRCYNKNDKKYKDYGGRGITVCDTWLNSFQQFLEDMGEKPSPKHSIERKDNNGNYCKENCVWETKKKQAINRRNTTFIEYNGEIKPLAEWAEIFNIRINTLHSRINHKWDIHKALTTPVRERN